MFDRDIKFYRAKNVFQLFQRFVFINLLYKYMLYTDRWWIEFAACCSWWTCNLILCKGCFIDDGNLKKTEDNSRLSIKLIEFG